MTGSEGLGMTRIGVQMRTKRMSNGGPTLRGRAKLSCVRPYSYNGS